MCSIFYIDFVLFYFFLYFGTTRHSLCFHWAIHLLAAKLSVTLLLLFLFLFLLLNYSHLLFVCTTGNTCRNSVKSAYFCVDYAASKSRHTRKITLIDIRTFLRCHQRLAMQFFSQIPLCPTRTDNTWLSFVRNSRQDMRVWADFPRRQKWFESETLSIISGRNRLVYARNTGMNDRWHLRFHEIIHHDTHTWSVAEEVRRTAYQFDPHLFVIKLSSCRRFKMPCENLHFHTAYP